VNDDLILRIEGQTFADDTFKIAVLQDLLPTRSCRAGVSFDGIASCSVGAART
jgi:hypothetical protein